MRLVVMAYFNKLSVQSRATLLSAMLTVMVADAGCGTWLGNPKNPDPGKEKPAGNSTVSLKIVGTVPTAVNLVASDVSVIGKDGSVIGTMKLSQARLSLSEIILKLDSDDATDKQKFEGPYIVDLLANSVRPDPGTIELPDGVYRKIKLNLHKLEADDASGIVAETDPIIGNSIVMAGTFTNLDGQVKSVTMTFDLDEEFELLTGSGFGGMTISPETASPIIIAFKLDQWLNFYGKSFDFADIEGSAIVMSKDSEDETVREVRDAIKDNVKSSTEFGEDEDGDGELEDEEDSEDD